MEITERDPHDPNFNSIVVTTTEEEDKKDDQQILRVKNKFRKFDFVKD